MSGKTGEAEAAKAEDYVISEDQAKSIMDKGYSEDDIASMTEEDVNGVLSEGEAPTDEGEVEPANTITEDMVKEYGLTKSFVGKPITELAKAYSEAQKTLNRKENEFNQTLKQLKENKPESIPDISLLEPDQQQEALSKLIDEKLAPFMSKYREEQAREQEQAFFGSLQEVLPEGQEALKTFNEWRSSRNLTENDINAYMANPNLLIDSVANYATLKDLQDKLVSTEKNGKKEVKKSLEKKLASQLSKSPEDGQYKIEKTKDSVLEWTDDSNLNATLTRIHERGASKLGV